jgi:NTE family protein
VAKSDKTLGDWLSEGPFGLAMSSGFFGFFAHAGMLSALERHGLLPARVSGSSAGALIAGLWATGHRSERIEGELSALRRTDFWDPSPGLGLLRGRLLRQRLKALLADDFESCSVPVAISVHDLLSHRPRTIRSGPLVQAVHASCALPIMFQPVWIGGRPYADGGITDRPGLLGMGADRVLFHHLVSKLFWRREPKVRSEVSDGDARVTLVMDGLPRVGPFTLEVGMAAHAQARRLMERALDQSVSRMIRVGSP